MLTAMSAVMSLSTTPVIAMGTDLMEIPVAPVFWDPLRWRASARYRDECTIDTTNGFAISGIIGGHDDIEFLTEVVDCLGDML